MADRSVVVTLRAEVAQYKRALAEAAVSTDRLGASVDKSGKQIDKLSGRLRLFAEAGALLGPALIPLGASIIPAITAAMAGMGAAAGAIGTTVLAFNGIGDALKSIDKARLEPTAKNLQEMRVTLEELGPAGADFARYLANLRPVIDDLQNTARAGIFPGLEDGIDALLERGPQVERIIGNLADGMGNLARDAGESLSSEAWTPFFDYVEREAQPTLEAFGQATGNVALGVANMLVAFGDLSSDFTGGLVDATEAFANWSANLDSNESFQGFLDYIRTSGPQVIDFLGALVGAFTGLIQAAAPFGSVVLPALTGIANAFAAIASSPIGPGLYAAAAGMIAFNRASIIAEKSSARFAKTWAGMSRGQVAAGGVGGLALLASSLTDVDDKAHLANTTLGASAGLLVGGPWGLAVGAAIGQVLDLKAAYDDAAESIESANDAMRTNDIDAMTASVEALNAQLDKEHPTEGTLGNYMDAVIGSFHDFTGQTGQMENAVADLKVDLANGGDAADLFGETIGQTGDQMRVAAGDAQALSSALSELAGWLDKREAVRGYRDAIAGLGKSMKDGFGREDVENLDAIGRSILQVAENIKSPKLRGEFLAGARADLEGLAKNAGPKAVKAIDNLIGKMDELGLTHPDVKITADDKRLRQTVAKSKEDLDMLGRSTTEPTIAGNDNPFRQMYGSVKGAMKEADQLRADPKVSVDPGNSLGLLGSIKSMLASIQSKTVTVTVNRRGGVTSSAGGHSSTPAGERMSGRTALGPLDPSDVYTSSRGNMSAAEAKGAMAVDMFGGAVTRAGHAAEGLKSKLEKAERSLDRERRARDELRQAKRDFSAMVGGAYSSADPFEGTLAQFDSGVASNIGSSQAAQAALAAAAGKGLNGPLYQALAGSGNLALLQQFAGLSAAEIDVREQQFATQSAAQTALGNMAGNAVFGQELKDANKNLTKIENQVRELRKDVKQSGQDNAREVGRVINGAASQGYVRGGRR